MGRARPATLPPAAPVPQFDQLDDLARAACLLALDPASLGGLCLRGPADEARELALQRLQQWLAPSDGPAPARPWRRLPLQVDEPRLLGGLDLGLSLAAGRPVHQPGLLAECSAGVLVLPSAQRAPARLTALLASAMESGPGPVWIVLDDSQGDDPPPAAALMDRLALICRVPDARQPVLPMGPLNLPAAREALAQMPFDAEAAEALCGVAASLGLPAPRAAWQAWRAACLAAACAGRSEVAAEDLNLATRLVLGPRARCLPAPPADDTAVPPEAPPPAETPEPPAAAASPEPPENAAAPPEEPTPAPEPPTADAADAAQPPAEPDPAERGEPLADQLIEAAQASLPAGLLAHLAGALAGPSRASSAGRAGPATQVGRRGRPLSSRRGPWHGGAALDLPATLRAALPWQTLRQRAREALDLPPASTRVLVRREDLHLRRFRQTPGTTTVFVVDASGSQAMHRLAEAKGAVECLLADCYVRRDRVALLAFRGAGAEVLLAPTRSLVRARRSLAALPGGGGTPLAAGIEAAAELALQVQRRDGDRVLLVFLTDARANIARDGSPGRPQAMADALQAARAVRAAGLNGLLIDTSARPQLPAAVLAEAMALQYVPLPQGNARAVHAVVSGLMSAP